MELIRRVMLALGVLAAVWCAVRARPLVVRVSTQDFAAAQQRVPRWMDASHLELDAFIADQTADRLVQVRGSAWADLFVAADRLARGESPGAEESARRGRDTMKDSLFFVPDESPVSEVAGSLSLERPLTYAAVARADGVGYLRINLQFPADVSRYAPAGLLYPVRRYAPWLLLAGLAAYLALPRPRRQPDALCYSTFRAAILPDLLSLGMAAMFFGLPLLVVQSNARGGGLLEGGWVWLLAIGWIFAAGFLTLLGVAAHYASYSIALTPEGIAIHTLRGKRDFHFGELVSAQVVERKAPRTLLWLGWFVSLLNWRAFGPTLLIASRSDPVLELVDRDGRRTRITLTTLPAAERLLAHFRRAGFDLDAEAAAVSPAASAPHPVKHD